MYRSGLILLIIIIIFSIKVYAQDTEDRITDVEKPVAKYLSWLFLQALPSPVWLEDANEVNNRVQFALRWNVAPVNYSFNANKYVSPVQFFVVNPVRRFSGSVELFVQPEWAMSNFDYSGMDRFGVGLGSRLTLPLKDYGETFAASIGGKYTVRNSDHSDKKGYWGLEAGFYVLYGIFGTQFNYNFDDRSKYNFGMYFKFF